MLENNKAAANNQSIVIFGEVLIDQFPDGQQVLGGAAFNVAWHLQALDQSPQFISRIGHDVIGEHISNMMSQWGMTLDNLQIDPDHPTGTVEVSLINDEPCYEILADQAYDFISMAQLGSTKGSGLLYHGSLALRNNISNEAFDSIRAGHSGKIFMDVNLRAPWWNKASIEAWLRTAHWVKLNHEELIQLGTAQNTLRASMHLFLEQHDLDVLVVTCGASGASALNSLGEFVEVTPSTHLTIVDTVGAGDAFSAVLLLGIEQGWPLPVMMARAQAFASASVTQRGATTQNLEFYREFIRDWSIV